MGFSDFEDDYPESVDPDSIIYFTRASYDLIKVEAKITELEKLPDVVTEFDEALWGSLVETVTVYGKEDIRFLLPCEIEIKGKYLFVCT